MNPKKLIYKTMFHSKKVAAIISYLQIALNLANSLLITPFVLRLLGQNEYGVYQLCTSIISYLSLFQVGLEATYIRYYIKYDVENRRKEKAELNGMILIIFGLISVITTIVGFILISNVEVVFGTRITQNEYQLARTLLKYVVASAVLTVFTAPFSALVTAHEEFVFQRFLNFLTTLLRIGITILLLTWGYRSIALVFISTAVTLLNLILNAFFMITRIKIEISFSRFDFRLFCEMCSFSFFISLQSIMDILNWQIDRILLARFWGTVAVSVYSVGAQFNSILVSLCATVTGLFTPKVNQMVAERQPNSALTNMMIRIGRLNFMISVFILSSFIFFGKPFLEIYAGTGYENSYFVAVFLMAPVVLPLSMDLWFHIARAEGKHKTSTSVFVAVAFLNLLISIPLCKRYGEIGAAAGTCIGMFIANDVFQIWYSQNIIHLDMKKWAINLAQISRAFLPPVLFGIAILSSVEMNGILPFFAWAVLYTLLFSVCVWRFAFNQSEKELILRPLKKCAQKFLNKGRK